MILAASLAMAAPPAFAQDIARGKALFAKCAACHSFSASKNDLGPNLRRIVGRKAGAVRAFDYSGAMRQSAIVWDEASLNAFLAEPRVLVPRTRMIPTAAIEDPQDRRDLIAYLKTQ